MSQTHATHGSDQSGSRRKLFALALGGLFIGLFVTWAVIRLASGNIQIDPPKYHGVVINSTEPLDDFTLTASTGEQVRLSDFRDRIVLLYYGYTYCPDICPATLAALGEAMERLDPGEREQVQVLMITVDPERDTPELLSEYLAHFDPSFLGLTGTAGEIATAAESVGIYYQKREGTVNTGYLVDHTATVVALDKDGRIRLTYAFNTPGKDIAADLRQLLKE